MANLESKVGEAVEIQVIKCHTKATVRMLALILWERTNLDRCYGLNCIPSKFIC